MPLDDYNGIDILGNMMESSTVSIDRDYYGDIHNMGHVFMAFAHDPEHRHLESFGVLGRSLETIHIFFQIKTLFPINELKKIFVIFR